MFAKRQDNADRRALEATTPQSNKVGPWWHDKGLRKLNILLFFPLLSEYTQGYDASIINNVQQLKRWQTGVYSPAMSLIAYTDMQFPDFNHPHGQILGLMSAAYWVGNIVGVVFISSISERLGRRHSMMFGALLCILGTALATASVNRVSHHLKSWPSTNSAHRGNVYCGQICSWSRWGCCRSCRANLDD